MAKQAAPTPETLSQSIAKGLAQVVEKAVPSSFVQAAYAARNFTPLHQAAWDNKTAEARRLLTAKADVHARDADGSTPLHSAAFAFGADVIPVLLETGADLEARDKDGATPLHYASVAGGGGGDRAIPYLLKAGADVNAVDNDGCTPLMYACRQGSLGIEKIKQLIAAGADVNRCNKAQIGPLHYACIEGSPEIAKVVVAAGANVNSKTRHGYTPLHLAARARLEGIVALLIAKNADINARDKEGWSAMAMAADNQSDSIVAMLRKAGAKEPTWTRLHQAVIFDEPEILSGLAKDKSALNAVDAYGRSPLFWALCCSGEGIIDSLIAAGADVTSVDKRQKSILHLAAWADRLDIVKRAVAAGAKVNAADANGSTALHMAAISGNPEIVRFLLDQHADVNAVTDTGQTPLTMAVESNHFHLIQGLVEAGADVLAEDDDGTSLEKSLARIPDKEMRLKLQAAIGRAAQDRIDKRCFLYSAENPHALRYDAIEPTTPNLAAVKAGRALYGGNEDEFAAMFVGKESAIATVHELFRVVRIYLAFRKELKQAFGADACQTFDELKLDNVTWTLILPLPDEGSWRRVEFDVQGDHAVCEHLPGFTESDPVKFVKQGKSWRIDSSFLTPQLHPDATLKLLKKMNRSIEKGRAKLRTGRNRIEDVKRAMFQEFTKDHRAQ